MKNATSILLVALVGALSLPAFAQRKSDDGTVVAAESAPGKATLARTTKVTGIVESIDVPQRRVVIKGPKGKTFPLTVGPDVRNLDQVKVGDAVVVRYLEALSLTLMKDGKELRGATQSVDGARSAAGEKPAGVIAQQVEATADVIAVDRKKQVVTLRGPKQVVELKVRDPEQLKLIKVGDQIHAVYTEALALAVEPAAPAKK
jgi:Cu/Ag efflux protein CusF